MSKDILNDKPSVFDAYIESVSKKPTTFVVALNDRPAFVFRRTTAWDEMQSIRLAAINQTKAAQDGNIHAEMKKYLGQDPSVMGRAVHLAKRHVGFMGDDGLIEEPWGEAQFIRLSAIDSYGFNSLMEAVNEEIGVGWTVEDRNYFREQDRVGQEEPDGNATAPCSAADMEPAS